MRDDIDTIVKDALKGVLEEISEIQVLMQAINAEVEFRELTPMEHLTIVAGAVQALSQNINNTHDVLGFATTSIKGVKPRRELLMEATRNASLAVAMLRDTTRA